MALSTSKSRSEKAAPSKKPIFVGRIGKASLWKSIIETMNGPRIIMNISPSGLRIVHENKPVLTPKKKEVAIIFEIPKDNFEEFSFLLPKELHDTSSSVKNRLAVSFGTPDHQTFIANQIKKKVKLQIRIFLSQPQDDSAALISQRIFEMELSVIPQVESITAPRTTGIYHCAQEQYKEFNNPSDEHYRSPINIDTSCFSQLRSLSKQSNTVRRITIQSQSAPKGVISFSIDGFTKDFGEFVPGLPVYYDDDEGWVYCGECEKYLQDAPQRACRCICALCDYPRTECECVCPCGSGSYLTECDCGSNPYEIVKRIYALQVILKFSKLPPSLPVSFREPKNPLAPLKLSFQAAYQGSVLGPVTILINPVDPNLPENSSSAGEGKKSSKSK